MLLSVKNMKGHLLSKKLFIKHWYYYIVLNYTSLKYCNQNGDGWTRTSVKTVGQLIYNSKIFDVF